jgi:DNA repair ATPase RecN
VESTVRRVDGEERVSEIARMMSGRTTAAAMARAGELLREGNASSGAGARSRAG